MMVEILRLLSSPNQHNMATYYVGWELPTDVVSPLWGMNEF